MTVKLLTEQHLEFVSLKGGCTGSAESTLVKMPYRWKSQSRLILFENRKREVFETLEHLPYMC